MLNPPAAATESSVTVPFAELPATIELGLNTKAPSFGERNVRSALIELDPNVLLILTTVFTETAEVEMVKVALEAPL